MSMVEQFFSVEYAGRGDLFKGLSIWQEEKYQALQGTYPVISLSFANVKEKDYETTSYRIRQLLMKIYEQKAFLLQCGQLSEEEKAYFVRMKSDMSEKDAPLALYNLSDFLSRYYGKNVIILPDEYDTPMQVTTTSDEYATCFGFTEEEVFAAMDEYGYDEKDKVKFWYDGFVFGTHRDIYDPWSILNYLDTGKLRTYWADTSSNSLVGKLIREGNRDIKVDFERLLQGGHLRTQIDEQIVYNQLDGNEEAIWSLLLASGYLKVASYDGMDYDGFDAEGNYKEPEYELELTNFEVKLMFRKMVGSWFSEARADYNDFIKALLQGNVKAMNTYMNRVALATFSYFDTGKRASGVVEPERFYHGFVLGLMVELSDRYIISSNRESGFGRYDVLLEPKRSGEDGIILEFKVYDPEDEETLKDTVEAAHKQIEEKKYEAGLLAKGIPAERIRKYGFAFEGKTVLIG